MSKSQGIAYSSLRAGKKYKLTNYGEQYEFTIEDVGGDGDFNLKDIHTLERYRMSDLTRFGKGEDFSIWEC